MSEHIEDLIDELVGAAQNVSNAIEWGEGLTGAERELEAACDALRAELAAKDAEIARLNNLLADAISTAREGVVELLDALHADEITQQEVIDSFRQYLLGNAETRICSYCGLLMSGDKAQQMTSHVMQCASNPLVQEIARLKERLTILNTLINDVY
jgi:sulfur relay (sulfurtransferase) DsrF/TusC family protein